VPSEPPEFSDAELNTLVEATRRKLQEQISACSSQPPPAAAPLTESAPPSTTAVDSEPTAAPVPDSASARTPAPAAAPVLSPQAERRVAIGADHGGYELKLRLVELLRELGYEPLDVGVKTSDAVDYPDYAIKVARAVARGDAWRGIMIDGAGIGSAMAANKVPGVLAATCHNEATVVNSREHNDANVLVLGSGQVNRGLARRMVRIWLQTPFGGGRHQRRVDKIRALDGT
jgi:ribose 5-phosphate isomerase B